jgi:DNA recombination protein RmuC
VWKILESAKTEFEKFEAGLDSVRKRLAQADSDLDSLIGTRTRAINRQLRSVTVMDSPDETLTQTMLDI